MSNIPLLAVVFILLMAGPGFCAAGAEVSVRIMPPKAVVDGCATIPYGCDLHAVASKTYEPESSGDSVYPLCDDATFDLPKEMVVTSGNAGNGWLRLEYDDSYLGVTCLYMGGSSLENPTKYYDAQHPQVKAGKKYGFRGCYEGHYGVSMPDKQYNKLSPGSSFTTNNIKFVVDGGDANAGTTEVQVLLKNLRPLPEEKSSGQGVKEIGVTITGKPEKTLNKTEFAEDYRRYVSRLTGVDDNPPHLEVFQIENIYSLIVLGEACEEISCENESGQTPDEDVAFEVAELKAQYLREAFRQAGIKIEDGTSLNVKGDDLIIRKGGLSSKISSRFRLLDAEYVGVADKVTALELRVVDGSPVYIIDAVNQARILGVVSAEVPVKITVNAETLKLIDTEKPWWASIAWT